MCLFNVTFGDRFLGNFSAAGLKLRVETSTEGLQFLETFTSSGSVETGPYEKRNCF